MFKLTLTPGHLSLSTLRRVYEEPVHVELDPACLAGIEAAAATVQSVIHENRTVYGINTGFGRLAQTRISNEQLLLLQRRLLLSHAAGVGPCIDDATVRLLMTLKIGAIAQGFSGVRLSLIEALISLLNSEVYPCIPVQGSVGASGDLAPLAHMSLALLGVGQVRYKGEVIPAFEGLNIAGLEPLQLAPKEGLSLINGTQLSTALALVGLFGAEDIFSAAITAGALSVEAGLGSHVPFDARLHQARGQVGQKDVAETFRRLLKDSPINSSHACCERVQDPYSLRCQPQVMGACLDLMRFAAGIFERESNAVSDNPLVFAESGEVLSGGNFHAQPIAMAADTLALSIAEIGAISERRVAYLIDSEMSQLPPFLVLNGGLNSGFMSAQVTAAALASENKSLAHPACVDSLPTSANQEDHVSMAPFAARRLTAMNKNTAGIVAIELLSACQGLDFRAPIETSEPLKDAMSMVRGRVPMLENDRFFAPDIQTIQALVHTGAFRKFTDSLLPSKKEADD